MRKLKENNKTSGSNQNGAVLTEAAIALPVFFFTIVLTGFVSLNAIQQNYIQNEIQETVRAVALTTGGYCDRTAEDILRDKLHYHAENSPTISVTANPQGDSIDLEFQVELEIHPLLTNVAQHVVRKMYRVRIENPHGCLA